MELLFKSPQAAEAASSPCGQGEPLKKAPMGGSFFD